MSNLKSNPNSNTPFNLLNIQHKPNSITKSTLKEPQVYKRTKINNNKLTHNPNSQKHNQLNKDCQHQNMLSKLYHLLYLLNSFNPTLLNFLQLHFPCCPMRLFVFRTTLPELLYIWTKRSFLFHLHMQMIVGQKDSLLKKVEPLYLQFNILIC